MSTNNVHVTLNEQQRKEAYLLMTAGFCRLRSSSSDARFVMELSDALHNLPAILLKDSQGELCSRDLRLFDISINDAKQLLGHSRQTELSGHAT